MRNAYDQLRDDLYTVANRRTLDERTVVAVGAYIDSLESRKMSVDFSPTLSVYGRIAQLVREVTEAR